MRSLLFAAVSLLPFSASAFCGFYVSGAGGKLFNDASMVVLVRDGTRTVLSMQNNYRGPTENFALVVPVPVVLAKENVKTIPREAFTRMDELTSPRLVEMPTEPCLGLAGIGALGGGGRGAGYGSSGAALPRDLGVKVEAKFEVEEYEIVILSAKFSLGLEVWLKENKYQIPEGAAALLQPYVQTGSKFFVAKVDAKKAKFKDGRVVLSPLRFHYDSEQFSLPVRLGLVNSSGSQDLIVHVVAKDRYELANMKNVLVPTNFDVRTRTQPQFGGFYKELLERTFKRNPGAAITEFAWQGALPPPTEYVQSGIYGVTCDPCPPPHPVDNPLARYLGVNLLPKIKTDEGVAAFAQAATVTRLHLRLTPQTAEDLVFRVAEPIHGGIPEAKTVTPARSNRFQGRYVMWVQGCGSMGGMFSGAGIGPLGGPSAEATKLIDPFEQLLVADLPELDVKAVPLATDARPLPYTPAPPPPSFSPGFGRAPVDVKVGALSVSGELSSEVVRRVVQAHRGQLRYCYEREVLRNPGLRGKLVTRVEIGPTGAVSRAEKVETTLANEPVESCVLTRLRSWTFPPAKDEKPTTVTLPLQFSAP